MKHRIVIENQQTEKSPFRGYKTALREAVAKTLEEEGFSGKAAVDITLVSAEEIARLNRDFRGVDRKTDVLSFPLEEEELVDGAILLGDVIVCPSVIFEQAKAFGTSYREEFSLMVIHSVLHLLGWDHIEEKEKKKMFAKQEKILFSLCGQKMKTEEQE